jgi:hypothetical protein
LAATFCPATDFRNNFLRSIQIKRRRSGER